jgi:hypothetical protein
MIPTEYVPVPAPHSGEEFCREPLRIVSSCVVTGFNFSDADIASAES